MIVDCVRAELLKLRRRPSTWILGGVYAAVVVLFNYLILYLLLRSGQLDQAGSGINPDEVLAGLLPASFTGGMVGSAAGFGSAIALIFGALMIGSEYNWRTVKTIAVQRPSRMAISLGRLVSAALVMVAFTVIALLSAVVASLLIAVLESGATTFPSLTRMLGGVGATWLLLVVWAGLGMALATLFRGTGLAIGLGLVWALIVESLASSFPLPGRVGEILARVLLGTNGAALSSAFADTASFGAPPAVNTPWQAVLALTIYLVIFAVVTVVPYLRREIA